ncbi:MAG TPA: diguanylate cyclase [Planctomycetota bacterium]|jgi:diguanylate cyclase (GGDEF)-like protein
MPESNHNHIHHANGQAQSPSNGRPMNSSVTTLMSGHFEWPGRVPFFSRLWVKIGFLLAIFVLLAMSVLTYQQLRETIREIERGAVEKGRTVAGALVPMVIHEIRSKDTIELRNLFNQISRADDIDYVQVVDSSGRTVRGDEGEQLTNEPTPQDRVAPPLPEGWVNQLQEKWKLGRTALAEPWSGDNKGKGVDIFVPLVEDPRRATLHDLREEVNYLRIGVNFDSLTRGDIPRLLSELAAYLLLGTAFIVTGLIVLLGFILKPLRDIHLGLRALAAGDLQYEVPVTTRDEIGRIARVFNVTAARLKAAFAQIEALATHDHLTALPNRRVFDERLASEAARCRRYEHPFGLIMLDLDKFKNVNDQFGHPTGDDVLKYVGKTIAANIRETDLAARIGGEEFAVILPETGSADILAVAEKLRMAVAELPFSPRADASRIFHVTLSAGGVCFSGRFVTPEAMLAAADVALYRSKERGRNLVTMAGQSALLPRIEMPDPANERKSHGEK